jgi:hypothetical protein
MAGIYALAGICIARYVLHFDPAVVQETGLRSYNLLQVIAVAVIVLALALGTAVILSGRNAASKGERSWNATSRRLLTYSSVPLVSGGLLCLVFISKGLIVFVPALTMLFYGMALCIAGNITFGEIRYLGLLQVILGLVAATSLSSACCCGPQGLESCILFMVFIYTSGTNSEDFHQRSE